MRLDGLHFLRAHSPSSSFALSYLLVRFSARVPRLPLPLGPLGLPLRYPTDFYYDDGLGQHLDTNNTGYVLRFNRLVGGARMRQVRWKVVGVFA